MGSSQQNLKGILEDNITAFLKQFVDTANTNDLSEFPTAKQASLIGFSGELIRGSLTIVVDVDFLKSSHPAAGQANQLSDEEIIDWLGEIANQICGRLKNELRSREVMITMGTPSIITGESFSVSSKEEQFVVCSGMMTNNTTFAVRMEAMLDENCVIPAESKNISGKEGSGMFF